MNMQGRSHDASRDSRVSLLYYTVITHLIGSYCKIFPRGRSPREIFLQYDPIKCVITILLHLSWMDG